LLFFHVEIITFFDYKETSIFVKIEQFKYLLSNINIFGSGIGYEFQIGERNGFLIENLFLYWLQTYGIIGFIIYCLFMIIYPIYIFVKYKNNKSIFIFGLTYLSIVISSISNPYLMSGTSILILMILISYDIQSTKEKWRKV